MRPATGSTWGGVVPPKDNFVVKLSLLRKGATCPLSKFWGTGPLGAQCAPVHMGVTCNDSTSENDSDSGSGDGRGDVLQTGSPCPPHVFVLYCTGGRGPSFLDAKY